VTIPPCYWLHVIISTSVGLQTSGIDKATKHLIVQGGAAVGPRIYRKLKLFVGSFRKDTILVTKCSILDFWYETGRNFTNNCWGALDYTSLVVVVVVGADWLCTSLLPTSRTCFLHIHYELDR